jgi:glycerophosphoryl diester phosphodiesterase
MTAVCILVTFLFLIYVILLSTRHGHKGLNSLKNHHYAHRGLHGVGVPENSMSAFEKALENGYGIELDLHLLKDGTLAVMHDNTLIRTTGKDGVVEDLTVNDLKNYTLENTNQTIPNFNDVLNLFNGKSPMIIELKPYKNNHKKLVEAAVKVLKGYKGEYCIESFDPRCLMHLKRMAPDIVRGQLSQNFFKANEKLNFLLKFVLTNNLLNFLTKPDFIAYRFSDRKNMSNIICSTIYKTQMVGWTITDEENINKAKEENWLCIFENTTP